MNDWTDEQIEALIAAATPGPWEAGDRWVYTMSLYEDDRRLMDVFGVDFLDPERIEAERKRGQVNTEFIAAARELVPSLLARAQRAEADRDAVLGKVSAIDGGLDVYRRQTELERDRLAAQVAAVRALHRPYQRSAPMIPWGQIEWCRVCDAPAPCPTIRALDGAMQDGEIR